MRCTRPNLATHRLLRTVLLVGTFLVAGTLVELVVVNGDGKELPNDYLLFLSNISDGPPQNSSYAVDGFGRRASKIEEYAACGRDEGPSSSYKGALNSNFSDNLEAWGADALAKLAYTGDCPAMTASARYQAVDKALSGISIPINLVLGTTIDPRSFAGITFQRHGELDTGLKELIPIVYMFKDKIPTSYDHVLDILVKAVVYPPGSIIGNPPNMNFDLSSVGNLTIPETENHTLLELSEQYLTTQLFNQRAASLGVPPIDNTPAHDYLMQLMKGILSSDFFEYNAKPYQHYALYAMENLSDFAGDADVATAAQMVLDFAAAKFAMSSSLLRRSSPFRRKGSHDGDLFTGSDNDEQLCRFFLYSGQLQTIYNGGAYLAPSGCASAVREAIGKYRVPNVILDIAIAKGARYFQTFSGGPSYFAALFGNQVSGATEVYDNEGSYLITAGGIPEPNGLPANLNGSLLFNIGTGFIFSSSGTQYSDSDEDVGISLPTLLIPNDSPNDPTAAQVIVDRTQMVRIAGTGHQDSNLCVAPGFACGKNPTMPTSLPGYVVDGPWQFATLSTQPVSTYVAMLTAPAYLVSQQILQSHPVCDQTMLWPFQIGLFEAEPATSFASFNDFKSRVKSNNPGGAAIFGEIDGYTDTVPFTAIPNHYCTPGYNEPGPSGGTYLVTGWEGRYVKTDGTNLDFAIPTTVWGLPEFINGARVNPVPAPSPLDYAVQSADAALPSRDPSTWDLADGPLQANRSGILTITSPVDGSSCQLDISDIHNPQRIGCLTYSNSWNRHSGYFIQSKFGTVGNFEMLVPESGGLLVHYWRDNGAIGTPWHKGATVVSPTNKDITFTSTVKGAALLESNLGPSPGNLEAVAWIHDHNNNLQVGGGGSGGDVDYLAHYAMDAAQYKWYGPDAIKADGQSIDNVSGPQ